MGLTSRSTEKTLPGKDALVKCKEVAARTVEAAVYLQKQFVNLLTSAGKVDAARPAIDNINEFVDLVMMQQESRNDYWSGKAGPLSDFQNLQQNMAEKAAQIAATQVEGDIKIDFAINNKAQFVRGYSTHGENVDAETTKSLDKLLNAYLAEHNLISKGSVIYEGDEKGQIRRDSKGQPMLADVQKAKQVLSDSAKGFEHFLQQSGKSVKVNTEQHDYPKGTPAATKASAVESTPTAVAPSTPETTTPTGPSA